MSKSGTSITVDNEILSAVLNHLLSKGIGAEESFAVVACAAVALARDIGGLDEDGFIDAIRSAWEGTPSGLLSRATDTGTKYDA